MTAARALRIDDWVVHRPNVVRSVAARVPGIDAEEAASRALEKMVRIVSTGGTIDAPAAYWRRAAVNEAISMTREAGRAHPVEDDTLDGLTPPVAGAELDAERQADVSMLRTALSQLADDDRQLLLERHVHDKAVSDIATSLKVRPHAVTMRLRRAEERLAGAFAAAHAQAVNEPECRTTRAAMHDYLKDRLLPRRRARFEVHMDGCAECTRAFVDVREVSWMLRDLGQHVIAGAVATGALGAAIGAGAAGAAGGGAGAAGAPRSFGKKEAAIVAGVLAALALGGGAAALVANQPAEPPAAESAPNPGAGGGAGGAGDAGGDADGSGDGAADDSAGSGAPDGSAGDNDPGSGTNGGDANDDVNGGNAGGGNAGEAGAEETGPGNGGGGSGTSGGADSNSGDGDKTGRDDGGDTANSSGAGGGSEGVSGGTGSGNDPNDSSPEGTGSGTTPGTGPADGGGDSGSAGGRTDNGREDEGSRVDGSGTADGANPGIGAAVTDWLAQLGIGGNSADGENGGSDATGTSTDGDGDGDAGDRASAGRGAGSDGDGDTGTGTGTQGTADGEGTTTADGTNPGIGAEMTSWLANLGAIGIPGFLLIVLILWLWERWSRAEEG